MLVRFTAAAALLALTAPLAARQKPAPSPADFGQWERLVTPSDHGGLSPDGRWLAYGINRSNRENELRVLRLADATVKVIPFGTAPVFSADSRWLACAVGLPEKEEDKLRKDKKPIHRKLALMNLGGGGEVVTVDAIETFAFSADGSQLLMRRYAPERAGGERKDPDPPAAYDPEDVPGVTTIVRDLQSGRDTTFGNVSEFAWQTNGSLLALVIAAEDHIGNGIQVFDPAAGRLRVLDSSAARYAGVAWRKDAGDLVVLRSRGDDKHFGAAWAPLGWIGVGTAGERAVRYEPPADSPIPGAMRIVPFRKPSWSEDGRTIFLGLGAWLDKPASVDGDHTDAEETAAVDVWHARDVDVMPRQKVNARRDRERSQLAAWDLQSGALVRLGRSWTESVAPLRNQRLAYAVDWSSSALERSWGRYGTAELSLIDLETGARTKAVDRVDDRFVRASPGGKYLLYYLDGQYWTVDTGRRSIVNLTRTINTSFFDRESDSTDVQKPWFGVAGWTTDDRDVLLYDKFDVWQVAADGSRSWRLTDGAAEQARSRYVALDDSETAPFIDRTKPIYFELSGVWSKKSGYARLAPGAASPERLLWADHDLGRLARAKKAEVYEYVAQDFDDSPDAFVGGGDLKSAKQVTTTNAFQNTFAWGRAELIEYKNERGVRLQGALRYPAGFDAARTYPMIVYVYEKRSDALHQYSAPSEREYYNIAAFTAAGYFVLEPDIVFRPREPGLSVVECVRPAVAAVVQKGLVDPKRVGVIGHSWGGFDAAFLATHSETFAAAVAGAPITDLVSNYGNHHWGPGIAETDHIETGQQRMVVPLWEDSAAYLRNSAVFGVGSMTTPLLIEVGDADGTVFWHQGVELYNAARRARKNVVLLVYANEDHGLRERKNEIDYHRRILDWFGHYLKGEPAKPWIASGVSYLDREREVNAAKKKGTN